MHKGLVIAGRGVLVICVLLAVGWGCSRALGPSSEQREALALLEQPWEPAGSNAFDDIWLLDFDVPEAERAALTDVDATWIAAQPAPGLRGFGEGPTFVPHAQGRYPSLALTGADDDRLCKPRDAGCLDRVRADPQGYRELMGRSARQLQQVEALARHGHLRSRLPPRIDAPFPKYGSLRLGMTAAAVRYVEGDVDVALLSACSGIATWRRIGNASDSLVTRMIGIAYAGDGYARLLADMLRDLPVDRPLPQVCRLALAPAGPGEGSICQAVRGEFTYFRYGMQSLETASDPTGKSVGNLLFPLAFDADMTIAEAAPAYARWCDASTEARVGRDAVFRDPANGAGRSELLRLDCMANAVGCVLGSIASPDMSAYQNRALDQIARLQVLATLLWLRDNAGDARPLAERVASRPPELRGPARQVTVGPGGDTLRIRQYDTTGNRDRHWQVPLPAYLLDPPAAD